MRGNIYNLYWIRYLYLDNIKDSKLNNENTNNLIYKWAKDLNKQFSREDRRMATKPTSHHRSANQKHNEIPFYTH